MHHGIVSLPSSPPPQSNSHGPHIQCLSRRVGHCVPIRLQPTCCLYSNRVQRSITSLETSNPTASFQNEGRLLHSDNCTPCSPPSRQLPSINNHTQQAHNYHHNSSCSWWLKLEFYQTTSLLETLPPMRPNQLTWPHVPTLTNITNQPI